MCLNTTLQRRFGIVELRPYVVMSSVCPYVAVGHSRSSWHATLQELTVTFKVTCCADGRRHLLHCTCARLRRKCRWRSLASFCYI